MVRGTMVFAAQCKDCDWKLDGEDLVAVMQQAQDHIQDPVEKQGAINLQHEVLVTQATLVRYDW